MTFDDDVRKRRKLPGGDVSCLVGALLLALALLVTPTSALAQTETLGPWNVSKLNGGCSLSRFYDEDHILFIVPLHDGTSMVVSLYDPAFESIVKGQRYDAKLNLYGEAGQYSYRSDINMAGVVVDRNRGVAFLITETTFLGSLKRSTRLRLVRESATGIDFLLDGNIETAVEHLQRCIQSLGE